MYATTRRNEGRSLIVTTTGTDAAAARVLLDRVKQTAKTVGDLVLKTEQAAQRHLANLRAGEMPFTAMPTGLEAQVASLAAYVDATEVVGLGEAAKQIVTAVMAGDSVAIKAEPSEPESAISDADRDRIGEALAAYIDLAGWIKPVDEEKAEYERLATTFPRPTQD